MKFVDAEASGSLIDDGTGEANYLSCRLVCVLRGIRTVSSGDWGEFLGRL
jgi:hypothetical protein